MPSQTYQTTQAHSKERESRVKDARDPRVYRKLHLPLLHSADSKQSLLRLQQSLLLALAAYHTS